MLIEERRRKQCPCGIGFFTALLNRFYVAFMVVFQRSRCTIVYFIVRFSFCQNILDLNRLYLVSVFVHLMVLFYNITPTLQY